MRAVSVAAECNTAPKDDVMTSRRVTVRRLVTRDPHRLARHRYRPVRHLRRPVRHLGDLRRHIRRLACDITCVA